MMSLKKTKGKYMPKRWISFIAIFIFSFTLNSCTIFKNNDRTDEEEREAFESFCTEEFSDTIEQDTFSINFMLKDPEKYDIDNTEVKIDEVSEERDKSSIEENKEVLKKLKEFDYDKLTDSEKITYDTLKIFINNQIELAKLPDIQNVFSPSKGIISSIPNNFVEYIIDDEDDAKRYIKLVKSFKDYIDSALNYTRKQSDEGFFMTDYAADKTIEKCRLFLNNKNNNPFITTFDQKVDKLSISDSEKNDLKDLNKSAVYDYVNSSYSKVIDVLEELKGTGKNDKGVCEFKSGKDYYENLLKTTTGTYKSMKDTIHDVEENLDDCVKIISTSSKTTEAVNNEFTIDYREGSEPQNIINYLKANIDKYYPKIEDSNYYVDYQDKSLEVDGVIAYYMTSRIDDWKENHIKINGTETKNNLELLYTTLAHESYPGHLYQHVYFCQTNPNPIRFLTENLGYAEGWAEYAADSSLEFLEIDKSIVDYLKAVDFANSLLYTRMDIGINYEGWDLKDLKGFLEKYGIKDDEAAQNYFNVIVADPGLMLPYTIGKIEMLNLRKLAESKMQDKFDIKEFNKVILDTGNVPFEVLKEQVEKYISKNA